MAAGTGQTQLTAAVTAPAWQGQCKGMLGATKCSDGICCAAGSHQPEVQAPHLQAVHAASSAACALDGTAPGGPGLLTWQPVAQVGHVSC